MASRLGTPLPPRSPAWFWLLWTSGATVYFAWASYHGGLPWFWSAVFGTVTGLILIEPRLRRNRETVQVDDTGVLRVDGEIREQIAWDEITAVRIETTGGGPWSEDVFFVLKGSDTRGCLVPHDAAVRTRLLEELQKRFPIEDKKVIEAMGSTSTRQFVIYERKSTRQ